MPATRKKQPYIWDDESGEPCPMTIEEFDARLEASNRRMEQEIADAEIRLRELEELADQKEAILVRLGNVMDEAKRECDRIDARVAVLRKASRKFTLSQKSSPHK